jgi:hypothetical protein
VYSLKEPEESDLVIDSGKLSFVFEIDFKSLGRRIFLTGSFNLKNKKMTFINHDLNNLFSIL